VLPRLYLLAVLFGSTAIIEPQDLTKNVRGSVISIVGPIPHAAVLAYDQTGNHGMLQAITALDGSYQFEHLPSGTYVFKVEAAGFHTAEIRDVKIDDREVKILPAMSLDLAAMYCPIPPLAEYYRLLSAATGAAALSGSVKDQKGRPIARAIVKFVVERQGAVAVQKTAIDGTFSFPAIQPGSERCWITVERDGYFAEEVRDPKILAGFESVAAPITLESCPPGRCQPYLKTIRVLTACE